jgi:hypothetical protein
LLSALTFFFSFGFSIYGGVFQNFLRDVMHAGPLRLGELESLREIPGLLAAITAGTLVALAESKIAGLGMLITGIGIGVTGFATNFQQLILITVFWSIGFHLYVTVGSALTLALAKGKEGGRHLGRMNGIGGWATLGALMVAWALSHALPHPNGITMARSAYNIYFVVGGACIALGAICCMCLSTHAEGAPRARIVLRKEYGLFYLLTFLEGCRRQIFSIFASFALILVYHAPLSLMLAIQLINAVLISITAPQMGKFVDRVGEKGPLRLYSIGLILVFLGYASFKNMWTLAGLFLLDNILFSFSVGYTTYLNRIVRKDELTPCLAMGTTMNHIAAVSVPICGALLWRNFHNYQIPFWVGVAIAFAALIANRWLPDGPAPKHDTVLDYTPQAEQQERIVEAAP